MKKPKFKAADPVERAVARWLRQSGKHDVFLLLARPLWFHHKWTIERALAKARECKTRGEFTGSRAYQFLSVQKKLYLLDQIHPVSFTRWTLAKAIKEYKAYQKEGRRKTDFIHERVRAYLLLRKAGLQAKLWPGRTMWTLTSAFAEARRYPNRTEFKAHSASAYNYLLRNDKKNIDKIFKLRIVKPWNKASAFAEAKKYSTLKAFRTSSAYAYLIRQGQLKRLRQILPSSRIHWTVGMCLREAKKYTRRADWAKNSPNSCRIATKRGWIGKCTAHMY